jgi:LuxR family maltose regulon positive regulatory protein
MHMQNHPIRHSPTKSHFSHDLICTKLQVPHLDSRTLHRKSVVDRLSAGKQCRLIIISGPAASGKTTLTCQWIARDKIPVLRYSVDTTENESDLCPR